MAGNLNLLKVVVFALYTRMYLAVVGERIYHFVAENLNLSKIVIFALHMYLAVVG